MNTEALNRYVVGKGYLESAKMIKFSDHYHGPRVNLVVLPIHMLLGFSLELFFKAWILNAGMTSSAARAMGHDLRKLYDKASDLGLPSSGDLDDLVSMLEVAHSNFSYRYIEDHQTIGTVHLNDAVFHVMDKLDTDVDKFVGASDAHGLQPGH